MTNPINDDFPGFNFEDFVQTYSALLAEEMDSEMSRLGSDADRRQTLVAWLVAVLRLFVESRHLGWLRLGPFDAPPAPASPPDILFVSSAEQQATPPGSLFEAAELVIAVVGPERSDEARQETLTAYAAAGIGEYWRIDPDQAQADFYRLIAGGSYQTIEPDEGDRFHSAVLPNFWLNLNWLWQTPLPRISTVARELGLM